MNLECDTLACAVKPELLLWSRLAVGVQKAGADFWKISFLNNTKLHVCCIDLFVPYKNYLDSHFTMLCKLFLKFVFL